MNCISSVLRFDKEASVKRAALSVVIMLLDGLESDTFQVFCFFNTPPLSISIFGCKSTCNFPCHYRSTFVKQ